MTLGFAPETIELWPLERLQPYAGNAKTHGPDQVARIAASIAEFGWTVPVLVADDGEVIAGHGRIMAATELGLTEAPVIVLGHLTEAQRRAYRIADNKLTELGGWDDALLSRGAAGRGRRRGRPGGPGSGRGSGGRAGSEGAREEGRVRQSRLKSFAEAVANVAVGYGVAVVTS